jgi:release factor glutamine methyltransferase
MRNSKAILRDLQQQITLKEDLSEIRSVLYLVLEHVLGLSQADVFADKSVLVKDEQQKKLTDIISRINNHEPVQYILGSTYFYGRRFKVNGSVLIPRPETELLIEEVLKEINPFTPGTILDIGTGSGCIAVTLAKELPEKRIVALDISEDALMVAKENASALDAQVEFHKNNALTENFPCQKLEIIVSNPPYISTSEKGFSSLQKGGKVLVEINERFGDRVEKLFISAGFKNTRIVKDLQQKDRIVFASK